MIDPCPTNAAQIRSQFETRTNYYRNRIARIRHDIAQYPDSDIYRWRLKIVVEGLIVTIACYGNVMNITFNEARKELDVTKKEIEL